MYYVWGKDKNNSFKIHAIILKYKKNVNLSFKTSYQNILFPLETILKMAQERYKGNVESMCAKVTKHASKKVVKAEVNLNY